MLEDLLDHLFVLDKSEDSHLTLALGAGQGVHFINLLNQSGPGAVTEIHHGYQDHKGYSGKLPALQV